MKKYGFSLFFILLITWLVPVNFGFEQTRFDSWQDWYKKLLAINREPNNYLRRNLKKEFANQTPGNAFNIEIKIDDMQSYDNNGVAHSFVGSIRDIFEGKPGIIKIVFSTSSDWCLKLSKGDELRGDFIIQNANIEPNISEGIAWYGFLKIDNLNPLEPITTIEDLRSISNWTREIIESWIRENYSNQSNKIIANNNKKLFDDFVNNDHPFISLNEYIEYITLGGSLSAPHGLSYNVANLGMGKKRTDISVRSSDGYIFKAFSGYADGEWLAIQLGSYNNMPKQSINFVGRLQSITFVNYGSPVSSLHIMSLTLEVTQLQLSEPPEVVRKQGQLEIFSSQKLVYLNPRSRRFEYKIDLRNSGNIGIMLKEIRTIYPNNYVIEHSESSLGVSFPMRLEPNKHFTSINLFDNADKPWIPRDGYVSLLILYEDDQNNQGEKSVAIHYKEGVGNSIRAVPRRRRSNIY